MTFLKISALEFSMAGDKYLGRSYEEMDCQAFVERCMADVGYKRDLGGSNSWYRECRSHGWVGSPEDCVKVFGSVPKGALLFILEPVGPKTPGKFRDDGVGDATHMGIVTGRGDGAIHSSSSRGCVATSKFKGKTIPNGGWNRVGMLADFEYQGGFPIAPLDPFGQHAFNNVEEIAEEERMTGRVVAETGRTVNLRKKPGGDLIDRINTGSVAEILEAGETWCKVRIGKKEGYMMTEFLITDEGEGSGCYGQDLSTQAQSAFGRDDTGEELLGLLSEVYQGLRNLCERIEETIGKG